MTEIGFWCVNQGVQFSREIKGRKRGQVIASQLVQHKFKRFTNTGYGNDG